MPFDGKITYVYTCDKCGKEERKEVKVYFDEELLKPCIPDGWLWMKFKGILLFLCLECHSNFTEVVEKYLK